MKDTTIVRKGEGDNTIEKNNRFKYWLIIYILIFTIVSLNDFFFSSWYSRLLLPLAIFDGAAVLFL